MSSAPSKPRPIPRVPTRDELTAERCRRSLARFIREAWPIVEPGSAYVENWHVQVISEVLESITAGERDRVIFNIPPRAMKSLTVGVFWPAWEWLTRPTGRWLTLSYAHTLSIRDALKTRRLVESLGLRDALPDDGLLRRRGYQGLLELLGSDWNLTSDQRAKGRFENTEGGYRIATSFGGVATGEGGDRIVIDDPHSADQAKSDTERQSQLDWYDGTIPTRVNDPATSAIVVVMQRLHEEDLTGHLLKKSADADAAELAEQLEADVVDVPADEDARRWSHVCFPGEFDPKRVDPLDRRTEPGEPLDKVRLGPGRLRELRRELGSYGYAGQIQQEPSPDEGGVLKRTWWRRYSKLPALERAVCTWDLTFGGDTGTSYVSGQVWGKAGARCYFIDAVHGRWGFEDQLKQIALLSEKWPGAKPILVERAAAGEPAIQVLRKTISGIVGKRPSGSKEAGVDAISPFLEAGDIWLPVDHPEADELIEEAAKFPNGSNDDRVDAARQAILYLLNAGTPSAGPIIWS